VINEYELFKKEIFKLSEINLSSYKERQMKRRIDSLLSKRGFKGYQEYLNGLKENKELYIEFINFITINVSEFYRNNVQWEMLEEVIIPYLNENNKATLKIWSAACSNGQEPYSLAMLLNDKYPSLNYSILATDIDEKVLAHAEKGNYEEKNINGIPSTYLKKYMKCCNGLYGINSEVKRNITFKKHNLLKDRYPTDIDLIVCRNVLIYFTDEAKDKIYSNFNNSLKNGGVLFVGSTEQIINASKYNFKTIKTFFYKKEL